MDQINKFLSKISKEQALIVLEILNNLKIGNTKNYDIKKLKGFDNLFRLRKGKIRIVFKKNNNTTIPIMIEFREKVYKKL